MLPEQEAYMRKLKAETWQAWLAAPPAFRRPSQHRFHAIVRRNGRKTIRRLSAYMGRPVYWHSKFPRSTPCYQINGIAQP